MEITITTPALLFPAISLLMISYTTRFLHLAHLARSLHAINPGTPEPTVLEQIKNIRKRILLIRNMQATGISSLLLCVVCMFLLFGGQAHIAQALFIASLALMIVSLQAKSGFRWTRSTCTFVVSQKENTLIPELTRIWERRRG